MPEPASRRGDVVTTSQFTGAFHTPIFPLGVGGLDLNSALDAIAPGRFSRLTNCTWNPGEPRALTGRAGQEEIVVAAGASDIHSIVRLTDLQVGTSTYIWGGDGHLFEGAAGALTQVDTGYSGDPITFVPVRPALSGDPWTYLADRDRMRKVRADGLDLEIGLQAPTLALPAALAASEVTGIAEFSAFDGTNADGWTRNAGTDYSSPPVPTDLPTTNTTIHFVLQPGAAAAALNGFWSFWGLARTLNLDLCGTVEASDDDVMQFTLKLIQPWATAEVRLYVVVSETFSPSVLPGTPGSVNNDFYVLTIRPNDFAPSIGLLQANIDAAEAARVAAAREASLVAQSEQQGFDRLKAARESTTPQETRITRVDDSFAATRDPSRNIAAQAAGSADASTQFGSVGVPCRRGDFKRYGTTDGRDWSTVTGLILYMQAAPGTSGDIGLDIYSWTLRGGFGPDTMNPGAQSYDWRYTHYDPRTGAESNGSPIMDATSWLDSLRDAVTLSPAAYGDSEIHQRFYRRGGTLIDDWHYVGENDGDGAAFNDELTDFGIQDAGTLHIDHYQPVATVDDNGDAVLAQPVPILFGPYNGQLLALGDPYRPGHVYGSLPDQPDHWPPDMTVEVCAPSEQLMNGCIYGGQPYVFSREAGYAIYGNLVGTAGLTAAPTGCRHGLAGRWGLALGGGAMWIVSNDNIYRTSGGPEQPVANDLLPLFQGKTVNGYAPIDFTAETALRLAVWANELWFGYQDTDGARQIMVMSLQDGQWRHYAFGNRVSAIYADPGGPDQEARLLLGGVITGAGYEHTGTSDAGGAIDALWRTGSWDWGHPREEKLFGDQILDVDPHDVALTLQNFVNSETVTNPAQALPAFSGRMRTIWDSFGTVPQRARTLGTQLSWSTDLTPPEFFVFGTAITMQPDLTVNRPTNWDDLGQADEQYVMAVTLDCDTGGGDRTIIIERDWNGIISTIATLTINHDGRHKKKYSWTALPANQVRIRPANDCAAWILYRADWVWHDEPPRIARWDIHFENGWDQYYTGLDLYCDTDGATKRIIVEVDGTALTDPATGNPYWDIVALGRQVVHLTLPWGRGHVFRFYSTDNNAGLLYQHRWHLQAEPSEQANWNEPFRIYGTQSDKWLKGVVLEVDTFGETKTIAVQADETNELTTFEVTATGRQVVEVSFPQVLGRVFRIFPTDDFPSRLYSLRPIFDEEPFKLTRWETQELPFGTGDFKTIIQFQITLKSTAEATLTLSLQTSQVEGTPYTEFDLIIPSTDGVKRTVFVPPPAYKWILAKFVVTSETDFWLYQEETRMTIQGWNGGEPTVVHPFGNSDVDPTRGMVNASLAAARSGGEAA